MSAHSSTIRVKGVYAHLDCLLTGIERLKHANIDGFDVCAPMPRHEIEDAIYEGRPSPVRWWTLTGAITGLTFGFILTSMSDAAWPMINPGGKPTVALPPFAVIMFESTILLGTMATALGMLVHCGIPGWGLDKALKDPRWVDDKFGIVFTAASEADVSRITEILDATGAIEVTTGDDTIHEVPNA